MDWKNFFRLLVTKNDAKGSRPYFHTDIVVPEKFAMEELLVANFDDWNMTDEERKRLTLGLRKILHCHRYFNSLEFERITSNFQKRLINEKSHELSFSTQGGGVYLFLAILKSQHPDLMHKKIICETSEIPLPTIKLPQKNELKIEFHYHPHAHSYLSGFPSLWARPEILSLFDRRGIKREVA